MPLTHFWPKDKSKRFFPKKTTRTTGSSGLAAKPISKISSIGLRGLALGGAVCVERMRGCARNTGSTLRDLVKLGDSLSSSTSTYSNIVRRISVGKARSPREGWFGPAAVGGELLATTTLVLLSCFAAAGGSEEEDGIFCDADEGGEVEVRQRRTAIGRGGAERLLSVKVLDQAPQLDSTMVWCAW